MTSLIRRGERWILPIASYAVVQLRIDYAVSLLLSNEALIRMEQPFRFRNAGGDQVVVPEGDPSLLSPILSLSRATVEEGAAFDDGRLELRFQDGAHVSVPPSPDFEAWQVAGPGGLLIVSMPGGELSIWDAPA